MSDIYAENHQKDPVDWLKHLKNQPERPKETYIGRFPAPRGMTMQRFQAVVWRLANLYPVRTILASNYPQEPQHLVLYFGIDPHNRDSKPSVELLAELVKMGFQWNGYGWKIDRTPDEGPR